MVQEEALPSAQTYVVAFLVYSTDTVFFDIAPGVKMPKVKFCRFISNPTYLRPSESFTLTEVRSVSVVSQPSFIFAVKKRVIIIAARATLSRKYGEILL